MAYISFQPSDFFNTKLYTGNASTQVISSIGFDPDITWIKERDGANNQALFDRDRGDDKHVEPNLANAEATESGAFAFGTDQFTLGNWTPINGSGNLTAAWNWKAGTTSGLTGGTITPTAYSFNTTSGLGIYAYTGTGANATIPHGLGVVPHLVMVKHLSGASDWEAGNTSYTSWVYHQGLNLTNAESSSATCWNSTAPTSTVFSVGTNGAINGSGQTYIAYVFANVKGYSKFGSYIANNNTDGPFIYTGFSPAFVMIYDTTGGSYKSWCMFDTTRQPNNANMGKTLYANKTYVEGKRGEGSASSTIPAIDIVSNGFKPRVGNDEVNTVTDKYIYMAFAEFPFVSSNSIPTTAR